MGPYIFSFSFSGIILVTDANQVVSFVCVSHIVEPSFVVEELVSGYITAFTNFSKFFILIELAMTISSNCVMILIALMTKSFDYSPHWGQETWLSNSLHSLCESDWTAAKYFRVSCPESNDYPYWGSDCGSFSVSRDGMTDGLLGGEVRGSLFLFARSGVRYFSCVVVGVISASYGFSFAERLNSRFLFWLWKSRPLRRSSIVGLVYDFLGGKLGCVVDIEVEIFWQGVI